MRTFKKALYCKYVAALRERVVKIQICLRVCNTIIIIMIIVITIIIIKVIFPSFAANTSDLEKLV